MHNRPGDRATTTRDCRCASDLSVIHAHARGTGSERSLAAVCSDVLALVIVLDRVLMTLVMIAATIADTLL
jgi:hypothetical protein